MAANNNNNKPYHWTRRVRSVLSSVADIVGDWFYYDFIVRLDDSAVDESLYGTLVLVLAIVSSVIGLVNILVVGCGVCQPRCLGRLTCGLTPSKFTHLLETLLEDIPQLVVSAIVTSKLGNISPQAAFNLTTSSINFVLDFLDIFEPDYQRIESNNNTNDEEEQEVRTSSRQGNAAYVY